MLVTCSQDQPVDQASANTSPVGLISEVNSISFVNKYTITGQEQNVSQIVQRGSSSNRIAAAGAGEVINLMINGKLAEAVFVFENTDDFEDDSDDLYQFLRHYSIKGDFLPDVSSMYVSLLIDKATNRLIEALVGFDFTKIPPGEEEVSRASALYKIRGNEGVQELVYSFENYTFDFVYQGVPERTSFDGTDEFASLLPASVTLSLEVRGRR